MGYTVRIERDMCISSGNCVADAPDAFDFDGEDIAKPTDGVANLDDERLVRIARNCPAGAIVLTDADGNEVDLFA